MKLYQNPMSPPCRRVIATMYQLNMQVELQTVEWNEFQVRQDEWNASLERDRQDGRKSYEMQIRELLAALAKQSNAADNAILEIGRLQKTDEATDQRINRIVESYSGRLDKLQEDFNAMRTEQALTNQTLRRIESALAALPPQASATSRTR